MSRSVLTIGLSMLAGAAVGGAVVQGLHAQTKPPAYFFAEIDVTDPGAYQTYVQRNTPVVKEHGGRFLARGGKTVAMDGDPPKRIVIIAWENEDKAREWYTSAAYKEIMPIRDKAAKFRGFIVEGVSN
jgi:uncharacterized protein (DUF1330 family)